MTVSITGSDHRQAQSAGTADGVYHTAASQLAFVAAEIMKPGVKDYSLWRFGVAQVLDDYNSYKKFYGIDIAKTVFEQEPAKTGHAGLDAAIAGLAAYLARIDGWQPPDWVKDTTRQVRPVWFVSKMPSLMMAALRDSPWEFKGRGVFITKQDLKRV